jgi:hypothetical protein
MSPLAIPPAATAALPPMNLHPHGHGHKKGPQLDSLTDPSSSAADQAAPGSTQNVFSRLLSSLEQAIGIQPAKLPQPAQATPGTQTAQLTSGSNINTTA